LVLVAAQEVVVQAAVAGEEAAEVVGVAAQAKVFVL
jgi:hypothetical protein